MIGRGCGAGGGEREGGCADGPGRKGGEVGGDEMRWRDGDPRGLQQ